MINKVFETGFDVLNKVRETQQEQLDQIMEYLLMAEQDTISDADELEEYGFPEEGDLDGD